MDQAADAKAGEPICAFWCRVPSRPNFGDALTPWLIRRLTGQYPRFLPPLDPRPKFLLVGSILEYAGPGCTVWGAGVLRSDEQVSPEAHFLAVRGPLSRARVLACGGNCPAIFGDPALLLPRFYQPPPSVRRGVGIVAHYSEQPRLRGRWPATAELRLIDIQDPVESVIAQVTACEMVASSSLHGLVVSHAYGVPALWIKFRDLVPNDDTKFRDYFFSRDHDARLPVRLDETRLDADMVARLVPPLPPPIDLEPLWRSCPFRALA